MEDLTYRTVEANGLTMRLIDQGEGPTVLLCHGFPETAYAWRHQVRALSAQGYRVIAPDLRGFGGTSAPDEVQAYALQVIVGDMVALLDALDVSEAVIAGNDWGATLAWQCALLRPDRFTAVAAMGVPLMGRPPVPPTHIFPQTDASLMYTLYFQTEGVAEAEFEASPEETLSKIYYAASGEARSQNAEDSRPNPFGMVSRELGLLAPLPRAPGHMSWLSDRDLDVFVKDFQASGFRGGFNLYRNLDANWAHQAAFSGVLVETPALFIVGERDTGLAMPGMRELIEAQGALAPRLQDSVYLENCGHWAPQEAPDRVNALLLGFMGDVMSRA